MQRLLAFFLFLMLMISGCGNRKQEAFEVIESQPDLMAEEYFFMQNEEILEAILARFERESIEHWINDDGSVGFYARDAKTVDAIANAEIGNWVTLQ